MSFCIDVIVFKISHWLHKCDHGTQRVKCMSWPLVLITSHGVPECALMSIVSFQTENTVCGTDSRNMVGLHYLITCGTTRCIQNRHYLSVFIRVGLLILEMLKQCDLSNACYHRKHDTFIMFIQCGFNVGAASLEFDYIVHKKNIWKVSLYALQSKRVFLLIRC